MGSATPPKRMTRARAAAASATAATSSTKTTKSDRVTKSTKATTSTKATAASVKKAATAAVKKPAAKKSAASAPTPAAADITEDMAASASAPPAAKKPTATKKRSVAKTSTSSTTTSGTARATTRKRKARTFDDNDENDEDDLSKEEDAQRAMNRPAKKLRALAKKAADPETHSESEPESQPQPKSLPSQPTPQPAPQEDASSSSTATRSTRGRPKKSTATTATASTLKKQTPAAISRTRTRKTTTKNDDAAPPAKQPAKKTTRRRAAAGTVTTTYSTEPTPGLKSAVSRPAAKIASTLKKTVTFQEPEKENMVPGATTKADIDDAETATTGMRAKPVRKPAASGRTTRASARAATVEVTEKKPLSPKKDGQNRPLSRDSNSDDELATYEKTPLKPLMKSPVKPPSAMRKLELPPPEKEKDENSTQSLEPVLSSVLSSPARRPPPSPFKDAMKSPAKRVDAVPSLSYSSTSAEAQSSQSPSKSTMLQSPAKRPHASLQVFQLNQEQANAARSPTKMSLLNTPAKRPASPIKLLGSSIPTLADKPQEETSEGDTHISVEEISEEQLQSQIRAESGATPPHEPAKAEEHLEPIREEVHEESIQINSPTPQLEFPGRLSAVLPRHADPALKKNPLPVAQPQLHLASLSSPEVQASEPVAVDESPKAGDVVESSFDETMSIAYATPGGQHADRSMTESEVFNTPPETMVTEEGKEAPPVETNNQSLDTAEVEISKPEADLAATESNEESIEAPEVEHKKESTEASETTLEQSADPIPALITPPQAAPKRPEFGLRAKEREDDGVSDSEDELAFSNKATTKHIDDTVPCATLPATPAPPLFKGTERKITESAARAASRAIRSVTNGPRLGYTPLSVQLGAWRASSPLKARQSSQKPAPQDEDEDDEFSLLDENDFPVVETPAAKGFFDDEMRIRAEMENEAEIEALLEADIAAKFDKHDFNNLITDEDFSIITEDGEMTPINNDDNNQSRQHDESFSEPSQEYGDENSVPIDPVLIGNKSETQTTSQVPVTPKRSFASREFHTVSKVPLKRGDDSPPRSVKRLCSTASKASLSGGAGLSTHTGFPTNLSDIDEESTLGPTTPSKPTPRPSVGTPARATRPDLDPTLLRGAVVFVDVHTTEGADAGTIFVDLLIQMGARCVKSWPWNPAGSNDGEKDVSKIGITHVVFKDGGKRTLEKVIESNGAVQCVGVSWVLDCEKENRWVEEKDYRVDTSLIPRGGHNRRKSMEPKAIANVNGTLVTPMKANQGVPREPQTVPNNYMSRRDSTVWMRSPSEQDDDEDAPSEPNEMDWESTAAPMLTPIPQTPAPEAVARFAMNVTPGMSTGSFEFTPDRQQLLMQTCPPKASSLINPGEGFVDRDQDQSVMMRLMAARRKSMQFAPKVASPLKKQWE
ncbi:putative signal transducer protein [Rosellinia necatrix]|uniref:Putative signal transducer protein n=1 Tax=Rosellinia necatrix TaxID=77044 RepID=A0A1S7ULZ2_ROSNE|nr:putative signal transducer protein [Rosellinia necatrix]